MATANEHRQHADALQAALTSEPGRTEACLRRAVEARASGGPQVAEPYDSLAAQIGAAAYRVTDDQVEAVRAAAGSEKGTFEIIMSASIGAGLTRWDAAIHAIEEAGDAPA